MADRVSTRARRACVSLSITGSVLVMGAVVLAVVTLVLGAPHSLADASALAWLLFACGLVCGGIMIAVSGSAPGRARPARRARRGARTAAPAQPEAGRIAPELPAKAAPAQAPAQAAPAQSQSVLPQPVPPLPQRIPGRSRPPRLFGQAGRGARAARQVAPAPLPAQPAVASQQTAPIQPAAPTQPSVPAPPPARGESSAPWQPAEPVPPPAPAVAAGPVQREEPAQPQAPATPAASAPAAETGPAETAAGQPDPGAGLADDPGPTEDWIKALRQGAPLPRRPRPD